MTTPDDDMLQSYLAGCGDNLATLEQSLLTLELGGTAIDEETVNRGMRAVHAVRRDRDFSTSQRLPNWRTRRSAPWGRYAPGGSFLLRNG